MQLSKYFTLNEMTKSRTALARGWDNTPTPAGVDKLKILCARILEPTREHFGRPVIVTSAYRSPRLNRAVRGSKYSQHMLCEAADIEIPGVSNYELAEWIRLNIDFDQLILEFYSPGIPDSGWVHVSYRENPRGEYMTALRVRRHGIMRTEYVMGRLVK